MKRLLTAVFMTLVGAGLVGFNWWYAITHGVFYFALCLMGPCLLVFGLVAFIVPMESLMEKPVDEPNNAMMASRKQKLNPLGWLVLIIGFILGGVQYAMLKYGLFM